MKKQLVCIAITVIFVLATVGQAGAIEFTQNEFITAQSLDSGMTQVGINFSLDNDYKSFYLTGRYGIGALFDVGVKGGALVNVKPEQRDGALVGVDLKYQFIKQTEGVPIDLAADLGFDSILISRRNVNEMKFSTIVSRSFTLTDRGYKFTPYGGLQVSALFGSYLPSNDTNFYVFGGLEWKITQKFIALVELKTGQTTVGGLGVRIEF